MELKEAKGDLGVRSVVSLETRVGVESYHFQLPWPNGIRGVNFVM